MSLYQSPISCFNSIVRSLWTLRSSPTRKKGATVSFQLPANSPIQTLFFRSRFALVTAAGQTNLCPAPLLLCFCFSSLLCSRFVSCVSALFVLNRFFLSYLFGKSFVPGVPVYSSPLKPWRWPPAPKPPCRKHTVRSPTPTTRSSSIKATDSVHHRDRTPG